MRRLIVVVSVFAALVLPTGRADAATAGACTWDAAMRYTSGLQPPVWGAVAPVPTEVQMALRLNCVGVGTQVWDLVGGGSGSSSCGAEVMSVSLVDRNGAGQGGATWVRAGVYGWMIIQLTGNPGSPSGQYGFEGPLGWNPGGLDRCVTQPAYDVTMMGLGPHMGV